MSVLLEIILPVFLVIGAGYLAVKYKAFPTSGVDGLMKFTQQFAIPCLLFKAIAGLELSSYFEPRLLSSYYGPTILMFFLGMIGARILFKRPLEDSVAIGFCCMFANSVLLGLPITERAYGAEALDPNYAIVALNAPICYGLGILVMETVKHRGEAPLATIKAVINAIFHNVLILAIALGFVVNLMDLTIPKVADDALGLMIRAALPAAIFALGGMLAQYKFEGDLGPVIMICLLALLLRPALSFGLSDQLSLSTEAMRSSVLTAAMAPGVNAYIFASMYGVAMRVAASAVLAATALSVLTITGWLLVLP
ncbi:AEC family transporter [uncultured Litoreibacter sp.]|uniref:AEC family transporter n=1 Tax=uncultured Litoreibacter sp. TaxID=1392394 RepID=UPI0026057013|nr:AEC family transporter [uncultured Litoreibacter sp.]